MATLTQKDTVVRLWNYSDSSLEVPALELASGGAELETAMMRETGTKLDLARAYMDMGGLERRSSLSNRSAA